MLVANDSRTKPGAPKASPVTSATCPPSSRAVQKSLEHSVACLHNGQTPLHGSDKALKATELIYATFASAKRNQRIDLPLGADDELTLAKIFEGATFA